LFFTLIPVLALLSNYDQENCLINVGTEGSFRLRAGILTALTMVPLGIALEFIHVHIPERSYQEADIVAETCGVFGGIAFALAARWVDPALERTSRTAAKQGPSRPIPHPIREDGRQRPAFSWKPRVIPCSAAAPHRQSETTL
jgi:hypothetical protein